MYKLSTFGGTGALLASIPLSMMLSPTVAFENGLIENFQVVLLLSASVNSLRLMMMSFERGARAFHIFCALMFVMLAARELSWGRVFYPIGFNESGPVFVDMADYDWRLEAHAFMLVLGLVMSALLIRRVPLVRMWLAPLPKALLAVVAAGVVMQYAGEHGWIVGKLNGQTLEELSETVIYAMQPILCQYYHRHLNNVG